MLQNFNKKNALGGLLAPLAPGNLEPSFKQTQLFMILNLYKSNKQL